MKESEIILKIIDVLHTISGGDKEILPSTKIIDDHYIDSLSVFNVIVNLEKIFGIHINPMDATINDFQTPESITRLVFTILNKDKVT